MGRRHLGKSLNKHTSKALRVRIPVKGKMVKRKRKRRRSEGADAQVVFICSCVNSGQCERHENPVILLNGANSMNVFIFLHFFCCLMVSLTHLRLSKHLGKLRM